DTAAVVGGIEAAQPSLQRARLAGRKELSHIVLEGRHRILRLALRLTGVEVDRRQLRERAAQALHERVGPALPQPPQRGPRRPRPAPRRLPPAGAKPPPPAPPAAGPLKPHPPAHGNPAGGFAPPRGGGGPPRPGSAARQEIAPAPRDPAAPPLQPPPHPHAQ